MPSSRPSSSAAPLPRLAVPRLRLPRVRAPRLRRGHVRLLIALAALAGSLTGGWLVVRDCRLVAVEQVTVRGVSGPQAAAIRSALQTAGRDMTTLHVRPDVLRAAAAPYAVVQSVSARAGFPHRLQVDVVQHVPVAALVSGGRAIPVAGDGTLLPGTAAAGLAQVKLRLPPAGAKVGDHRTLSTIHLLAFAPAPLRARVTTAFRGADGLTVHLADGPVVRFGPASRLRAKWASLAAVLASGQARGAAAIDVRVPEHPAAAGLEQASAQMGPGQPSTLAGG